MSTKFEDYFYEETSTRVCEEVGPNSLDYDMLHDRYMDDESWHQQVYDHWLNHIEPLIPRPPELTYQEIWNAIRPLTSGDDYCKPIIDVAMDAYRAIERAVLDKMPQTQVWHEGSGSFYEAYLIRKLDAADVESKP